MSLKTSQLFIGLDLGGTNVRSGAFDRQGSLLATDETLIEAYLGPRVGLDCIAELLQKTIEKVAELGDAYTLAGIGIGCTGPIDPVRGTINNPYTLPTWDDVPILDALRERFDVPLVLENDADMAAMGEQWQGAARGVSKLYAVTVGTGIGTSFIIDGHIYRGLDGSHPEGGHQSIDPHGPLCYCGLHGCWEILASGTALAREASQGLKNFPDSTLRGNSDGDENRIDAKMVAQAARQGDALAISVIDKVSRYFSLGLANTVLCFMPDIIVLSGNVMKSVDLFLPAVKKTMREINVMVPSTRVKIIPAKLGNLAGIYGAAYTVMQEIYVRSI